MTAIIEIQPKLSKLIPLLASDESGEVVSAAAVIARPKMDSGRSCGSRDMGRKADIAL
ncbi:hypothetical protein [Mesorhizobium sp. A623]